MCTCAGVTLKMLMLFILIRSKLNGLLYFLPGPSSYPLKHIDPWRGVLSESFCVSPLPQNNGPAILIVGNTLHSQGSISRAGQAF